MTDAFDDRRRGFEAKWAHDADLKFQVEARRNRLLGAWAAQAKGLSGPAAEDFIAAVIAADFQEAGDADVFRKLRAELDPAQVSDAAIRAKMTEYLDAAVKALANPASGAGVEPVCHPRRASHRPMQCEGRGREPPHAGLTALMLRQAQHEDSNSSP